MAAASQLNIKNPETVRLAHELAKLKGETVTDAVTKAVRERLERERRKREQMVREVMRIVEESGPSGLPEGEDHTAFLYDEKTGLPR
jgi:antitoxin VapB